MTSLGVSSSVCVPPGSTPVPITDGQPQPWVMPPQSSRVINRYRHRQSIWFGAILIVLGCLNIIWNLVGPSPALYFRIVIFCVPCGVMFIVTGSVGISAGCRRKTKCPIITFLVLCIVASVMCIVPFLFGFFNAVDCLHEYMHHPCSAVQTAMGILMAITAALAALVAICGSSLSCRAMDCCNVAEAQPYGIPMMVISQQPSGQTAPMTVLAPTNTGGVYRYQMIPAQPNAPIQPLPAAMTVGAESYAPPDYGDSACAASPSQPLLPPAYGYAADHVDEKKYATELSIE